MEKSKLLTLIFSFIPGAGEMYMGMLNKGIFLMGICCLLAFFGGFLGNGAFVMFTPVIWFYSFFETWNLTDYTSQHRRELDAEFTKNIYKRLNMLLNSSSSDDNFSIDFKNDKRVKKYCGYILVAIGLILIYTGIIYPLISTFLYYINFDTYIIRKFFGSGVPSLFVSIILIYCGMQVLKNIKNDNNENINDFTEYKGDKNE